MGKSGQSTLCTSLTDSVQLKMLFADHTQLSTSSIISQHYCGLQSSSKCQLSHQQRIKTIFHGVLSYTFRNVSCPLGWFCRCVIKRLGHTFCSGSEGEEAMAPPANFFLIWAPRPKWAKISFLCRDMNAVAKEKQKMKVYARQENGEKEKHSSGV